MLSIITEDRKIIFSTYNNREALGLFEAFAIDSCLALQGFDYLKGKIFFKESEVRVRGFYLICKHNKITLIRKEKDGWFSRGDIKKLKTFRIFNRREPRKVVREPVEFSFYEQFAEVIKEIPTVEEC